MDPQTVKVNKGYVERASWLLVLLGLLTQLTADYAFPSYNLALGFWGVYCSISKHGRATLGLIVFAAMACLADILFCAANEGNSSGYRFALAMLVLSLFVKIYILYYGSKFFASIGGQYSLDLDSQSVLEESGYSSLGTSGTMGGGYYPPNVGSSQSSAEHEQLKTGMTDSGAF